MADESNSAIGAPTAGKLGGPKRRRIMIRTVALWWVIALFTAAVYSLATIPYQRARFLQAGGERAQAACASTAQVAVNAVMEGYSPLAGHCLKMVKGNPSLYSRCGPSGAGWRRVVGRFARHG